jgi:hypothetical protein
MHLVMNNKTETCPFKSVLTWTFYGEAEKFEGGFKKYLAKACGYPRHRAWADHLDMSHLTFCEDYARENGLRICHITDSNHIGFEKKSQDWLR